MGASERDKGARGEREVAAIFRAHGFDCDRVPNSGGLRLKGDLYGDLPVHVEVKRQERLQLWQWLGQARDEAGDGVPLVAFRRNGSEWYAALPLAALADLLKRMRCRYCGQVTHGLTVCQDCGHVLAADEMARLEAEHEESERGGVA